MGAGKEIESAVAICPAWSGNRSRRERVAVQADSGYVPNKRIGAPRLVKGHTLKMHSLLSRFGMTCLMGAMLAGSVSAAQAQEVVGVAAVVRNDVAQVSPPAPINPGSKLFANERVRTGQDSSAKLVFADDTNLAVGPVSTVTLDKFVFSGPTTYAQATLALGKGAFRFATGNSDKRSYSVNTGLATIGIRGTILEVRNRGNETFVRLVQGAASVCLRAGSTPRNAACRCTELTVPGETATVTATCASNTGAGGGGGWTFAFATGNDPLLLTQTAYAPGTQDAPQQQAQRDGSAPVPPGFPGGGGFSGGSSGQPIVVSPH